MLHTEQPHTALSCRDSMTQNRTRCTRQCNEEKICATQRKTAALGFGTRSGRGAAGWRAQLERRVVAGCGAGRPNQRGFRRSCLRLAAVALVHANPCATSDPGPCARDHTTIFATAMQRRKAAVPLRPELRGCKAARSRFSKNGPLYYRSFFWREPSSVLVKKRRLKTLGKRKGRSVLFFLRKRWKTEQKTERHGTCSLQLKIQGADHDEPVQLLLLGRCLGLVDRGRTRATGVVAPPAPP